LASINVNHVFIYRQIVLILMINVMIKVFIQLIIAISNKLRAFIVIRTKGAPCFTPLFGHWVMREINVSLVSIYERKAIDHRTAVTPCQ